MSAKAVRSVTKSAPQPERWLDLRALERTPGFMLRLAQLKFERIKSAEEAKAYGLIDNVISYRGQMEEALSRK